MKAVETYYASCQLTALSALTSPVCVFVCVGDEILELNAESLHGLSHDEALHKFKVRQLHHDTNSSAALSSVDSMIRTKRWWHIHG